MLILFAYLIDSEKSSTDEIMNRNGDASSSVQKTSKIDSDYSPKKTKGSVINTKRDTYNHCRKRDSTRDCEYEAITVLSPENVSL